MNKIKNYVLNHKKKCSIIAGVLLLLIILIIVVYAIISFLMPNTRGSVYGDRCEITEDHPIPKDQEDKLAEFLMDYQGYTLVSFDLKCNLIDIIIEVKDDESFSNVKKMAKAMLGSFDADTLKYYDLQLYIRSDKEKSENYPQLGTHHKEIDGKANEDFVW